MGKFAVRVNLKDSNFIETKKGPYYLRVDSPDCLSKEETKSPIRYFDTFEEASKHTSPVPWVTWREVVAVRWEVRCPQDVEYLDTLKEAKSFLGNVSDEDCGGGHEIVRIVKRVTK